MLQQTQVATVTSYYQRFLQSFPTVESLAQAPLEHVLEVWSGMGYYRRARHLHLAAQVVLERFGGRFPADYRQARTLPGVGDYTARAILSIAYHQPYAVVDGNVARVAARLGAISGNPSQPAFRLAVRRVLDPMLSRRKPGQFNQAIMELGQTLCVPRAPRCPECPVQKWCQARLAGRAEAYPAPKPRRRAEPHHLAAAIIARRGRLALVRGLDDGLLPEMWNFPSALGNSRAQATRKLGKKLAALTHGRIRLARAIGELRHNITFRSIRVHLIPAQVSDGVEALRWFPLEGLLSAAVSKLAQKIALRIKADKVSGRDLSRSKNAPAQESTMA